MGVVYIERSLGGEQVTFVVHSLHLEKVWEIMSFCVALNVLKNILFLNVLSLWSIMFKCFIVSTKTKDSKKMHISNYVDYGSNMWIFQKLNSRVFLQ